MQALKEEIELRRSEDADGDGWSGTAYYRYFTCAKGDVATHQGSGGELEDGAVLPTKWGGVATSTAADPRLQRCVDKQNNPNGAQAFLETVWISIDT